MIVLSFSFFHMRLCVMSFSGDIGFAFLSLCYDKLQLFCNFFLLSFLKETHKYVKT